MADGRLTPSTTWTPTTGALPNNTATRQADNLRTLVNTPDGLTLRSALLNDARSRLTPSEDVRMLARLTDVDVRRAALTNRNLPVDEIRAVFARGNADDQADLFRNDSLPVDLLTLVGEELLATSHSSSRTWNMGFVLRNPRAPRDLLARGLTAEVPEWVNDVAGNRALPDDMATELMRTGAAKVRQLVARHASADVLANHDWERETALRVLRMVLTRSTRESHPLLTLTTAEHQRLVTRLLTVACNATDESFAAEHSRDPAQLLQLCEHPFELVRSSAARNVLCPEEGKVMVALQAS